VVSSLLTIEHLPNFLYFNQDPFRWYGVDVQYEYNIGYKAFLSHRIFVYDGGLRSSQDALKIVNKYRHQHNVLVSYDPDNPQRAVLEPGNMGDIIIPLILGAFLAFVGLLFLGEISFDPSVSKPEDHLYWGNIYQKQQKFGDAFQEFNKLIDLNPSLAQGYKSRGNLNFEQGHWPEAIADFDQAIGIDPTDAQIHYHRALAYLAQKQYTPAFTGMQKAAQLGYQVDPKILEEIRKGLEGN